MTSSRAQWRGKYDVWKITGNAPDWSNILGMYLFTQASVSSYTGVSMNRSRISKFNSLNTTQGSAALYFYPCFMSYGTYITGAVVTASYNGMLGVSDGNTDMPGTLDYNTFGPFEYELGPLDTNVYFCFLVTNSPIDENFSLSSDPYGVLFNGNFKTDAALRYFFES